MLLLSLVFWLVSVGWRLIARVLGGAPPAPRDDAAASARPERGCVDALLPLFDSPSGRACGPAWRRVSADAALPLRVYHHVHGHSHLLRVRAPLDAPAHAVLACAREIDLVPLWNPFVTAAALLEDLGPARVRAAVALWTPPPLPRASLVLDVWMVDMLRGARGDSPPGSNSPPQAQGAHGAASAAASPRGEGRAGEPALPCLLVLAASPEPHAPLSSLPAALRGRLRLPAEVLARLTPRADGGTDVELVGRLPATHVPALLVDAIISMAAPRVYLAAVAMLRTALTDGAPLAGRIAAGPQRRLYAGIAAECELLRRGGPPSGAVGGGGRACAGARGAARGQGSADNWRKERRAFADCDDSDDGLSPGRAVCLAAPAPADMHADERWRTLRTLLDSAGSSSSRS